MTTVQFFSSFLFAVGVGIVSVCGRSAANFDRPREKGALDRHAGAIDRLPGSGREASGDVVFTEPAE
jgi:hypothetical protein